MTQIVLYLYTEDEEEDEDHTEPKAGLESDQREDEESKDTKDGKTGLCKHRLYVGIQTFGKTFFFHEIKQTLPV